MEHAVVTYQMESSNEGGGVELVFFLYLINNKVMLVLNWGLVAGISALCF